jgi:hypothetical protein
VNKKYILASGDICLGVAHDGVLHIGGNDYFKVPCGNGKFIVSQFGTGNLLLIRLDAESSQLLSAVSPGISPFEAPFHIQGCILRPSRIRGQNHNGRKNTVPSTRHQAWKQAQGECRQPRNGGRGCNSLPASSPTTGRYTPAACTGSHSNNKQSLFRRAGMLVRSLFQPTRKTLQSTGDCHE